MSPKRPILLWDVMSTLVTEPFLQAIPRFFGLSLDELRHQLDPRPWVEFEHGRITEKEYAERYFRDGRALDVEPFKAMLYEAYSFMDGVEPLLVDLHRQGYVMHALSNYPSWYEIIEAKLEISRFMSWDFVSCRTGHRKPDPEAYLTPLRRIGGAPEEFIFIDDRAMNTDAAAELGMKVILRTPDIQKLRSDLEGFGVTAV